MPKECFVSVATEYLASSSSYHRSNNLVVSKPPTSTMIPPAYLNASRQVARRALDGVQAVPSMDDATSSTQTGGIFTDCVLDLSKYLNSSDLPSSPQEFFDDLFDEKQESLETRLPGSIKIKEEPDSTATSRCSTPESLLPEHDFDKMEFPEPQFQSGGVLAASAASRHTESVNRGGSLMCQLQSINHSSTNTTDVDSNDSDDEEMSMEKLDLNARKLKEALAELEAKTQFGTGVPGADKSPFPQQRLHPNKVRSKPRKPIEKGSEEYVMKRERNNVAVRKSRTKAKLKHIETQMRVGELTEENSQLRNRISVLQKELNALKAYISFSGPQNRKPPCYPSYPPVYPNTPKMI